MRAHICSLPARSINPSCRSACSRAHTRCCTGLYLRVWADCDLCCVRAQTELCYTPMMHAALFAASEGYRRENFQTCEGDRPLFAQFCANDPQLLLQGRCPMLRCDCSAML